MAFFSSVSGGQYILAGIVVLITAGSFLNVAVDSKDRLTVSRFLLALIAPVFWTLLFLLPPWGKWVPWLYSSDNDVLKLMVSLILIPVAVSGVGSVFALSIVIWVSASLDGTLRQEINSMKQSISVAVKVFVTRRRNRKR